MRTHRHLRWDRILVTGLVLLLIAQGVALLQREAPTTQFLITPLASLDPGFVTTGSPVPELTRVTESGATEAFSLAGNPGELTVLMVFSESCAHADLVKGSWGRWMTDQQGTPGLRIIPVSGDQPASARRYGEANGWPVQPISLSLADLTAPGIRVLNRTPWVFLLDSNGQVLYDGHGDELGWLDDAVTAARTPALASRSDIQPQGG